ncbi:MAG: hypothetical protein FWC72_04585 [Oscillospiraceae bacterium]|nr:hypothetical protein [Oscillospiraceae bacterium]
MKKIFALLLTMLLFTVALSACDAAETPETPPPPPPAETEMPTPTPEETPELPQSPPPVEGVTSANVQVHYADALFDLSQFDVYHAFTDPNTPEEQRIAITTDTPIYGFHFVELGEDEVDWGDGELHLFEHATVLHSVETLTPDIPFVINWLSQGTTAHRGIVFWGEDIPETFFSIQQSGYDGAVFLSEIEWRSLRSPRTAVTGILEDPSRTPAEITVSLNVGWSEEREELIWETRTLSGEDVAQAFEILTTIDAIEILTPFHNESQQADPVFQLHIAFADGSTDLIIAAGANNNFLRFTGTFGSHGDPGYVRGTSDALYAILAAYF